MHRFFWILYLLLFQACRLSPDRDDINLSKQGTYRCGLFISHVFDESTEEVYPDLGLLLQNRSLISLSTTKHKKIAAQAKLCFYTCSKEKELIYLKEKALNKKIKNNQIKGDLTKVAHELNQINDLKKSWLKGHQERYQTAINLLNDEELSHWLLIEQMVKPFNL